MIKLRIVFRDIGHADIRDLTGRVLERAGTHDPLLPAFVPATRRKLFQHGPCLPVTVFDFRGIFYFLLSMTWSKSQTHVKQ
ncbi:MAG: hypothetical protein ABI041_08740 [Bdellovibrionia bacterium]